MSLAKEAAEYAEKEAMLGRLKDTAQRIYGNALTRQAKDTAALPHGLRRGLNAAAGVLATPSSLLKEQTGVSKSQLVRRAIKHNLARPTNG